MTYKEFLETKIELATDSGFEVDREALNPALMPHQKDAVQWALKGGRRALFESFGLGKTVQELEFCHQAVKHEGGQALIVCPLGVKQEFTRDAVEILGYEEPPYCKTMEEVRATDAPIILTNYERVRDGDIDPKYFTATSLDEAAVLRSFGSKTYQTFLDKFKGVKYKMVATATPSPNKLKELIHYAGYLEIMDTGQAQPLTAKVLTSTGWVEMGQLKIGDMVIAQNGKPTKVTGIIPHGVQKVFKITFSDGSATRCTADHLWGTQTQYQRNNCAKYLQRNPGKPIDKYWTVKTTEDISKTLISKSTGSKNHSIPMVEPVQFQEQEVLIDPYVLGLLLGNGNLRETSVNYTTDDMYTIDRINKALEGTGLSARKNTHERKDGQGNYDWRISAGEAGYTGRGHKSNKLLNALRGYGLIGKRAWEKSIPSEYLFNSVDVRLEVLRGLMDTDGTISAREDNRYPSFLTTSAQLAKDVLFIVQSLGGIANITERPGKKPDGNPGRLQYDISIRLPNGINPFALPRKANLLIDKKKYMPIRYIVSVEPDGEEDVQCINVEDNRHLYVTDDFICTHNCLTRFFQRDSTKANNLTLYPNMEDEFWLWVSSWALYITKPSDLNPGYSDEGYDLPPLEIRWHELPVKYGDAEDKDGQMSLFTEAAAGLTQAAKVKRDSLDARIAEMKRIVDEAPEDHFVLWHDLEKEREAIKKAIPGVVDIYGSQDYDIREKRVMDFSDGKIRLFATKKQLSGVGCNFQRHCHREIFLGIDYQFHDFIQAVHRCYRFLQTESVIIDIIYMENERKIKEELLRKWKDHDHMVEKMIEIVKKYGMSNANIAERLERKMGVEGTREERTVTGKHYTAVYGDCVEETRCMESNSVGLIHTSIPFGNHYEYSQNYNDFGHNEDTTEFFKQMDFLTPELLRVLKPGRVAAIHVKDRVLFGNATGTGMPTIEPFHALCIEHYIKHGFQYMGMITVVTDVVRENNQTYRLGWTENSKDGSKMGCGCPEYVLLFRKLPTDRSTAYADEPVTKSKDEYTRGQWQIDAHGYWRTSGDRLVSKEELREIPVDNLQNVYRNYSRNTVYSYKEHVKLANDLDEQGKLPAIFMVVAPGSWCDEVWDDINRMKTLNTTQSRRQQQMHVCLAEGSLVLTRNGYKPIENIEIGDMVLTHKGNWKPVIATACTGIKDTVRVKAEGVPNLILTPDHKLWCRKHNYSRPMDYLEKTEPTWIEAQDTKGGFVNLKLPEVEENNLSTQEWWIIGRYLADGHIGTHKDYFISVGAGKETEFEEKAKGFYGFYAQRDGCRQYRLYQTAMSNEMLKMLEKCGHGALYKQVPVEGLCLNKELSAALLDGYLSGDGNKTGNAISATSVSRALLLGMAMVAQRVTKKPVSVFHGKPAGKHIIEGRKVNQNQCWVMSWRDGRWSHSRTFKDGAWKRVKDVESVGKRKVYSIQVQDDASYTAEGCIVKNCPLQIEIVERIITRYSNKGDVVYDCFGGLMTVPMQAVKMGRYGYGCELNADYFRDGIGYLQQADDEIESPTLFDFIGEPKE